MQLKNKKAISLKATNVQKLALAGPEALHSSPYWLLLMAIAEMLDEIAKGENMYMSIGSTMKKDMYSLSIKLDGEATSMYAETLEELSAACADVVTPF